MGKEKNLLSINNLRVSIAEKVIINDLNLTINHGEVHAIMGPNGSGKSTLAKTIAGHPECTIHEGSIKYLGKEIIDFSVEKRASEGIFLGFQYPIEIPGLSNSVFLKTALNSQRKSRGDDEITAVDLYLIGVVLLIFGFGIYELFISKIDIQDLCFFFLNLRFCLLDFGNFLHENIYYLLFFVRVYIGKTLSDHLGILHENYAMLVEPLFQV